MPKKLLAKRHEEKEWQNGSELCTEEKIAWHTFFINNKKLQL